jgi:hypothetical protein
MADHADVLQIEVPGQRRRGFDPRQFHELVEDEAAVGSPDVTHVCHAGAENAGIAALTDDLPAGEHRNRRLEGMTKRDDHVATAGQVGAQLGVVFAQ